MKKLFIRMALGAATIFCCGTAYSLWYTRTHAYVGIHSSNQEERGTVLYGVFQDSAGKELAAFSSDETGVVNVSADGVDPMWPERATTVGLIFKECNFQAVPFKFQSDSKGNPLLWWVPHPHIGGFEASYYSLSIWINSKDCTYRIE